MPKVSVIIPVYNAEKYLNKCLDSVINQTLKDIEIICIDDCSEDASLDILRGYAKNDSRIKIIELEKTETAANARNLGIKNAVGDYVGFVDSDDYIDLDFYEKLYKKALETSADIVKGADLKICYPNGECIIEEQNDNIRKNKIHFWHQFTTAIYKTEFIKENKIDFPPLILGEDPVFTVKTACKANKISLVSNAQYYYMKRDNSLNSTIWNDEKLQAYYKHIELIADFIIAQDLSQDEYKILCGKLLQDIIHVKENQKTTVQNQSEILDNLYKTVLSKTFKYPIKLLFDATVFSSIIHIYCKRGIYYVAYNLIKRFIEDKRFDITLWLETNYAVQPIKDDEILKNLKIVHSKYITPSSKNVKEVINPFFNMYDYDVYINVSHNAQLTVGKRPAVFNVLHDVIPLIFGNEFDPDFDKFFYKFHNELASNANCFCVSKYTKKDFLEYFKNFKKENLFVTPIASANNFYPNYDKEKLKAVLNKYKIKNSSSKYIFYLGAVYDSRKNLIFTIECFLKFIEKYNIKDLYFYLGGSGEELLLKKLRSKLGILYDKYKDYIICLGFVDDEDVNILYSNSLFFSFLSLYEGFGMPPLEAMQAGVPVICSNNSSLPEVVDDAAIMVNPENEEEIIEAFSKLYFDENLRKELIKKGIERAKFFGWDKTYKLMSDRIIDIVSGRI